MRIGAQLYTVRSLCTTTEGLDAALRACAGMGYRAVQLSGVCAYDPMWMADRLAKYGLSAPLTHTAYRDIVDRTDEVIAAHKAFGASYVGLGSCPGFRESGCDPAFLEERLSELAPAVDRIAAAGLRFMYHNHDMEMARTPDGRTFLSVIADRFPAEAAGITLDCYWVAAGGGDPADWLRRLSGRVDCIHLKDMVYCGRDRAVRMAPVGLGNINHEAILTEAMLAGTKYAFVEQDRTYETDVLTALRISLGNLRAMGQKD